MINANSFLFAFYVKSINIYCDYYLYANYGMVLCINETIGILLVRKLKNLLKKYKKKHVEKERERIKSTPFGIYLNSLKANKTFYVLR